MLHTAKMKYTFCKHVGMLGLGVIFFQLSICGWYIYIIFGYTRFQNFDREWIWLFIVMAILFFVSTIVCILIWKTFAKMVLISICAKFFPKQSRGANVNGENLAEDGLNAANVSPPQISSSLKSRSGLNSFASSPQ